MKKTDEGTQHAWQGWVAFTRVATWATASVTGCLALGALALL